MMTQDQKRIRTYIKKWKKLLGIHPRWRFFITAYERPEDGPEKYKDCAAWVQTSSASMYSYIYFNTWSEDCLADLESVVTHELLHVLHDRMDMVIKAALGKQFKKLYGEITESVVENLEAAFRELRTGKAGPPRRRRRRQSSPTL